MINKPIRKKKVCKEEDCESEYIFSKGYCKHHAQLNKLKESKKSKRARKKGVTPTKKVKLMPISKLDAFTWRITSLAFRIDEADNMGYLNCATCGKHMYYYKSDSQCGHFMSRRFKHTKFVRENLQTQCTVCNKYRYGEQYLMGKKLDEIYGEGTANKMCELSNNRNKFTREDYKSSLIENAKLLMEKSKEKSLWEWRDSLAKWQNDFLDNLENIDISKELVLNKQRIC